MLTAPLASTDLALLVLRILPLAALDRTLADLELANAGVKAAYAALEQKNAELGQFNRDLEKLVAARTAEARAAAEEARKASEVKSAFLANMSHEIRTPMNAVFGMADLLSRTDLSTQQRRLVTTINQSATTLLTIINDILDLSRIEAGKFELSVQDFDLRECVEGVVEAFAQEAQRKGLDLNLLLPLSVPLLVKGDAGRLRQVLTNLIGNAMKFTSEGEVSVRLELLDAREGRSVIRFTVSDTGIGIDPAVKSILFKPFVQADSSISRRFGGTGLGLSISQHLVQMMDGEIALDSTVGKGTTVTFTVRLAQGEGAQVKLPVCPTVIREQRVLVVDDRDTNRQIICSYLTDCEARPETAASAEEALAAMHQAANEGNPFVLAVVDMIMPGINGLELARRVKADPLLAGMPLIMVTSLSWKADNETAREAGISDLLTKPVRRADLLEAVRKAFGVASAGDGALAAAKGSTPGGRDAFKGARVLVAEDNPVNQEVMREYASLLGCDAEIAENGRIAVAAFETGRFDVILMDCQMPEMDGLAACRRIREIERQAGRPRTPVIAVTANAYGSDRAMCLAADMDDFMSKPFTEAQLAATLARWLNAAKARASEPESGRASDAAGAEGPAQKHATLDQSKLAQFEKRKAGMAARLAELFLSTAPKSARQIMNAVVEDDHEKIRAAAHSLRSASANIGAAELARLAGVMEEQARSKQPMPACLMQAALIEAELCSVENELGRIDWRHKKDKLA